MRRMTSSKAIAYLFFVVAAVVFLLQEKRVSVGREQPQAADDSVAIHAVYDGDTVGILLNGREERIRLIGIDAPEIGQAPWGERAKAHLEAMLRSAGNRVRIERDAEERDQYGRLLAYLLLPDGRMANEEMLTAGYAVLYTIPPNVKNAERFRSAMQRARDSGQGLWHEGGLDERPSAYRKEHPRK